MISVVVPTIPGREDLLAQTKAGYATNSVEPIQWIEVNGHPTCGEAWAAGARAATGDYLHLTADDVIPTAGWDIAGIEAADNGLYPSPRIITPDGTVQACGSLGGGMLLPDCPDFTPAVSSGFPFLKAGTFTGCPPVHYYADDYIAQRARRAGLDCRVVRAYEFTHLEGTVGRDTVAARSSRDRHTVLEALCA